MRAGNKTENTVQEIVAKKWPPVPRDRSQEVASSTRDSSQEVASSITDRRQKVASSITDRSQEVASSTKRQEPCRKWPPVHQTGAKKRPPV